MTCLRETAPPCVSAKTCLVGLKRNGHFKTFLEISSCFKLLSRNILSMVIDIVLQKFFRFEILQPYPIEGNCEIIFECITSGRDQS